MYSIRPLQCGQNLTLHAGFPNTLPHNHLEELVTSIVDVISGVNASQLNASRFIEELPKCTKRMSILDTLFFSFLMGTLWSSWTRGLGRRAGMFPKRLPCDKSRCPLAKYLVDVGFASVGIIFTAVWRNTIGSIVVVGWAAFRGGFPDAVGMLLFFGLVHDRRLVAAIGVTGAYAA